MSYGLEPFEWAEAALRCEDTAKSWGLVESSLASLGFDNCAFVFDHPITLRDVPPETRKFGCMISEEWEHRLATEPELIAAEPVSTRILSSDRALALWRGSDLYRSMPDREQNFFRHYDEHGFKAGGVWPSHDRLNGTVHVLLVHSFSEAKGFREAIIHHSSTVHLALTNFCEALRVKKIANGADMVRLTPRERECLLWVQAGKTSRDIGDRLGVTESTVNEHITNATRKLGASNRVQASARAMMLRLIQP